MTSRSLSFAALLLLAAPTQAGERLLVAGSDGAVYQTSPDADAFEYFACACTGPATALAADGEHLYLADESGLLLGVDLETGAAETLVALATGPATALVATSAGLFVGTADAVVARVDPTTGAVLDQRLAPAGVRALATLDERLFVATEDSAIYSAPLTGGEFTYFSCFCFFGLTTLVADGRDLVAGDAAGTVIRIDATTGIPTWGIWTAPMNAMAVSGDDFLVSVGQNLVGRFVEATGEMIAKLEAPAEVRAMLIVRERDPIPTVPPRTKVRQRP